MGVVHSSQKEIHHYEEIDQDSIRSNNQRRGSVVTLDIKGDQCWDQIEEEATDWATEVRQGSG